MIFSHTFVLSFLAQGFLAHAQVTANQAMPQTPIAPGTFSNGALQLVAEPPITGDVPDPMYAARPIDLPFYRLYNGTLKFFSSGELNTPTQDTDAWGSQYDNANQSACGIPDNAFSISKVAIHPYFLKYADLSRYCMQDVCISFWKADGSSDMMLKVTDICSTDPNDPTHCATPGDIKIDRTKAKIMEGITDSNDPRLTGSEYPEHIWWFFTKCWDDGLAQPAYQGNNWFTTPVMPNNLNWSMSTASQQYQNNQVSYPQQGWPTYPCGGYNTERDSTISPPISDWVPGQEPAWAPIAGGVGWGLPISGAASPPTYSPAPVMPTTTSSSSPSTSSTSTPSSPSTTAIATSGTGSSPTTTAAILSTANVESSYAAAPTSSTTTPAAGGSSPSDSSSAGPASQSYPQAAPSSAASSPALCPSAPAPTVTVTQTVSVTVTAGTDAPVSSTPISSATEAPAPPAAPSSSSSSTLAALPASSGLTTVPCNDTITVTLNPSGAASSENAAAAASSTTLASMVSSSAPTSPSSPLPATTDLSAAAPSIPASPESSAGGAASSSPSAASASPKGCADEAPASAPSAAARKRQSEGRRRRNRGKGPVGI